MSTPSDLGASAALGARPGASIGAGVGALAAGALFGAGLVVSGMTRPTKVLAFLDPLGAWDPSLLLVMCAAIGVHVFAYRLVRGWPAPLAADAFHVPKRQPIDRRLLLGAVVFGAGWGLSGYCPGPSLVALPSLAGGTLTFVASMLLGTWLGSKLAQKSEVASATLAEPNQPQARNAS